MKSRPCAMIDPKVGAGGGGPAPTKDSAASARIAMANT